MKTHWDTVRGNLNKMVADAVDARHNREKWETVILPRLHDEIKKNPQPETDEGLDKLYVEAYRVIIREFNLNIDVDEVINMFTA